MVSSDWPLSSGCEPSILSIKQYNKTALHGKRPAPDETPLIDTEILYCNPSWL